MRMSTGCDRGAVPRDGSATRHGTWTHWRTGSAARPPEATATTSMQFSPGTATTFTELRFVRSVRSSCPGRSTV